MEDSIITKCSHPVRIQDKTRGGYLYVPCGKCPACRASYKARWMERLDLEARASTSVLFFTLTYDNKNLPIYTFDNESCSFISNRDKDEPISVMDMFGDDMFDGSTFLDPVHYVSKTLSKIPKIQNYIGDDHAFGYCSKSDIQKFFKRLRNNILRDGKNLLQEIPIEDRELRYFITSEYGPKTFRPHYHGLIFLRNERVSDAVEQCYLRESWKLCSPTNLDVSRVVSTASSYVAKYVNCDTNVPDILKIPGKTKTFYLSSRRPAIGVPYASYDMFSAALESRSNTYCKETIHDGVPSSISLPIPKCITNEYYPTPYNFVSYDIQGLRNFYSSIYQFSSRSQWSSIIKELIRLGHDRCSLRKKISTMLPNYCRDVESMIPEGKSLMDIYLSLNYNYMYYGISINRRCLISFIIDSSLKDYSVDDYVTNLCEYKTVSYVESLFNMYQKMENLKKKGVSDLDIALWCYPSYFDTLKPHINMYGDDELTLLRMNLTSLNLDWYDIYDKYGILSVSSSSAHKKQMETPEYVAFKYKLYDNLTKFEKTRNINHFINQKQGNYEAF